MSWYFQTHWEDVEGPYDESMLQRKWMQSDMIATTYLRNQGQWMQLQNIPLLHQALKKFPQPKIHDEFFQLKAERPYFFYNYMKEEWKTSTFRRRPNDDSLYKTIKESLNEENYEEFRFLLSLRLWKREDLISSIQKELPTIHEDGALVAKIILSFSLPSKSPCDKTLHYLLAEIAHLTNEFRDLLWSIDFMKHNISWGYYIHRGRDYIWDGMFDDWRWLFGESGAMDYIGGIEGERAQELIYNILDNPVEDFEYYAVRFVNIQGMKFSTKNLLALSNLDEETFNNVLQVGKDLGDPEGALDVLEKKLKKSSRETLLENGYGRNLISKMEKFHEYSKTRKTNM